jgi:hypothetical protein
MNITGSHKQGNKKALENLIDDLYLRIFCLQHQNEEIKKFREISLNSLSIIHNILESNEPI